MDPRDPIIADLIDAEATARENAAKFQKLASTARSDARASQNVADYRAVLLYSVWRDAETAKADQARADLVWLASQKEENPNAN